MLGMSGAMDFVNDFYAAAEYVRYADRYGQWEGEPKTKVDMCKAKEENFVQHMKNQYYDNIKPCDISRHASYPTRIRV